MTVPH